MRIHLDSPIFWRNSGPDDVCVVSGFRFVLLFSDNRGNME